MPRQPAIPIDANYDRIIFTYSTPTKTITETHWYVTPTSADNADLNQKVIDLANLRIACLAGSCIFRGYVISQENIFRDGYSTAPQGWGSPVSGTTENQGNNVLNILLTAGAGQYRTNLYLGAIPDDALDNDTYDMDGNPEFNAALNTYLQALCGVQQSPPQLTPAVPQTSWGFLPENTVAPNYAPKAIRGFTYAAGSQTITVTTTEAHGCLAGDVVRISGVRGVNVNFPMNQLWKIFSIPAGSAVDMVLNNFPATTDNSWLQLNGGTATKKLRTFTLYTGWNITGVGSRNRGNRTGSPLGRKKRKYNTGFPG